MIEAQIKALKTRTGPLQQGLVIRAHQNDGISTACEEVARCLQKKAPNWNISGFSGVGADRLPEVVGDPWVGERRFIKDALRARLIQRKQFSLGLSTILLVLSAGIAVLLGGLFLGEKVHWERPQGWIAYVIGFLLPLLASRFLRDVRLGPDPGHVEQLATKINSSTSVSFDASEKTKLKKLIDLTAGRLCRGLPKCIIIDDYSRLDSFSREVLLYLMTPGHGGADGVIFWVVFDPFEEKQFYGALSTETPRDRRKFWDGNYTVFELQGLSQNKRIDLLRKRGEDEASAAAHAAGFELVKHLVGSVTAADVQRLETNWNDFVATRPGVNEQAPAAVELFKFIALNGPGKEFELKDNELITIFAQKSDEAFPALISAYYGKTKSLRRKEVEAALAEIRERLMAFLSVESEEGALRINHMAVPVFKELSGGVVPKPVINMFWLLYWFARWRGERFLPPARLEKLYEHARVDPTDETLVTTPAACALWQQGLEAALWVTLRCLYRTRIDRAVVLVGTLMDHMDTLSRTDLPTQQSFATLLPKVSGAAWTAYAISGDARMLSKMMDVLPGDGKPSDAPGKRAAADIEVIESYLELNGVEHSARKIGATRIYEAMKKNEDTLKRLTDYMALRRWEFLSYCSELAIGSPDDSLEAALRIRESWEDGLYDISPDTEEPVSLFHFQNRIGYIRLLTNWNELDEAHRRIKAFLESSNRNGKATTKTETLLEKALFLEGLAACLDCFLSGLFSEKDKFGTPDPSAGYSFRQCAVLEAPSPAQQSLIEIFCSVLAVSRDNKSQPVLAEILAAQTARTYLQVAMAWDDFGLKNLRDVVLVRRADFLFRATTAKPDTPRSFESILGSMSNAMEKADMNGLVAKMVAAKFFAPIGDLRQVYLLACALQVLNNGFNEGMKFSFGVAALALGRSSDHALPIAEKVFDFLLTPEGFEHAVRLLTREQFATITHELLECAWMLDKDALFKNILDFSGNLPPHPHVTENRDLTIYVRFHKLRWELKNGQKPNWPAVLSEWENDRNHWLYPGVLDNALTANKSDQSLINRCFDYLGECDSPVYSTSPIILAERLVALMLEQKQTVRFPECVKILAKRIVPSLRSFPIEHALRAYTFLMELEPQKRSEHRAGYTFWLAIKLERDRIEKLRAFIEQGRYWRIFMEYFQELLPYGLPIGRRNAALFEALTKSREEALEWVATQDDKQREDLLIMTALVNNRRVILDDFIAFGQLVRSASETEYAFVEEVRTDIDKACEGQINDFFAVVAATPDVDPNLRAILEEHRREFGIGTGTRHDRAA